MTTKYGKYERVMISVIGYRVNKYLAVTPHTLGNGYVVTFLPTGDRIEGRLVDRPFKTEELAIAMAKRIGRWKIWKEAAENGREAIQKQPAHIRRRQRDIISKWDRE